MPQPMKHLAREPWEIVNKTGLVILRRKWQAVPLRPVISPCISVMACLWQRATPFRFESTTHSVSYLRFLLENELFRMDLVEYPDLQVIPHGYCVEDGLTIWGKAAYHWLTQGYCWAVDRQERDLGFTEDYYAGYWADRHDGVREQVIHNLSRTRAQDFRSLKQDFMNLKLQGTYDNRNRCWLP